MAKRFINKLIYYSTRSKFVLACSQLMISRWLAPIGFMIFTDVCIYIVVLIQCNSETTMKVLKMSLAEFSLPKFYQLFGISKVKSAAVSAFRTSYRPGDRSFTMSPPEHEKMSLSSLETIVDALLEIMEVSLGNLLNFLLYN